MIPCCTPIPYKSTKKFYTCFDNQEEMEIGIYEGESEIPKENHLLGNFTITGLTPKKEGEVAVDITYSISSESILEVTAVKSGGNSSGNIKIIDDKVVLSKNEIEEMAKKEKEKYFNVYKEDNNKKKDHININNTIRNFEKKIREFEEKKNPKIKKEEEEDEEDDEEFLELINNYSKSIEKLLDNLGNYLLDNETVLQKYYIYVAKLFSSYIKRLSLKHLTKEQKKEYMKEIENPILKWIKFFAFDTNKISWAEELYDLFNLEKSSVYHKKIQREIAIFISGKFYEKGQITLKSGKNFSRLESKSYFKRGLNFIKKKRLRN